jgi:alpha-galactosidase
MVFSTSPGETPIAQAKHIAANANMWRESDDFWDQWRFLDHAFDLAARWQGVGGPGHWPDLDMIPLGHIALRSIGQPRMTRFTHDEQRTLMSMWALAPSPLMLGMNLPDNDEWTLSLLSNDAVLAVNQDSAGNTARRITSDRQAGTEIWVKKLSGGKTAVGLFNRSTQERKITLNAKDADLTGAFSYVDLWTGTEAKADGSVTLSVPSHGAVLLRVGAEKL